MIHVAIALMTMLAPRPDAPRPAAGVEGGPTLAGINRFAFELFGEVARPDANVAVSPASLAPVAALCFEGARGETAEEIARTFHFPARDVTRRDLGALLGRWDGSRNDQGYQLVAANSLWGQRTYAFHPEFLRLASVDYRAPLTQVDFANNPERARRTINAWAGKNTAGLIGELLAPGSVTPDTRLALVNTVYFKAEWTIPFRREATRPMDFRVSADRTVRAPMMGWKNHVAYVESPEAQVVSLPYRGGDVAMAVVLPRKVDGLANVERALQGGALDGWFAAMQTRDVVLTLPRFESRTRLDLGSSLVKLGMRAAFDPSTADFGGITDERIWISSVVQEVVVKVDEEGTEAAAATAALAVGATERAGEPPRPVVFKADHPFVYVIRDVKSGAILFVGHVVDPTR